MKYCFFAILFMFAVSSYAAFGGPTTTITPDKPYEWELDTVISGAALAETTGTTTSDTIVSKRKWATGWEYIFVLGTVTGTNVATCSVGVRIDSYGKNDSLLTSVLVDSILGATDTRKLLNLHNCPGLKHSLVLQGVGSNGAQIIFNEMEIYRRRCLDIMKRW